MDVRLDGRIVLVTGAAQGVGRGIALEAAASGAAGIVVTDRDVARGEETLAALRHTGAESVFVAADLLDAAAPAAIFAAALARFGRVDALANAAGVTDRASLENAAAPVWDKLFTINTRAPFFLMQQFVAHLRQRKSPGAVVNILSINVHGGPPELVVYSMSKAALALATRSTAHAHRYDRIRVNGINLGWTDTPNERQMQAVTLGKGAGWLAEAEASLPFGRLLNPGDAGRLAVFLLSDASAPMTGAVIDQEQVVIGPVG